MVATRSTAQAVDGTTSYWVTALLEAGGNSYGSVLARVDDPPITSAEPTCAGWMQPCSTREVANGTAVVIDRRAQGTVLADLYRPDRTQAVHVVASDLVTSDQAKFWHGGNRYTAPLPTPEIVTEIAVQIANPQ
ncbi:hypothetical protein A4R43_19900 [Amycolatopsis albispora]|uniref:Uncharacterized protein n=1 Tax=Amycolatopsis albispora TaxID=1804986 RepID=A0A344L8X1_9PSEU|nr:hypothetical protein A4R43_19900 [Amycolatopsis albispora]